MQRRAVETREAIVSAAAEMFATEGYRATGLRDLARRAGVTQGAFYFHFDTKKAVAEEIIRRQHQASIAITHEIMSADEPGLVSVIKLSDLLADQIRSDPMVRAGLRLSTDNAEELALTAALPYREWLIAARVLLERARERRELRADVDLDSSAELIISAFSGAQFLTTTLDHPGDLGERLHRMWKALLPALTDSTDHPAFTLLAHAASARQTKRESESRTQERSSHQTD